MKAKALMLSVVIATLVSACATTTSPTGRKQYVGAVSQEQLDQLGEQAFLEAKAKTPQSRDGRQSAYVACVVDAIVRLVRAGRPETSELEVVRQRIAWGPGPRASQAFMLAARARAIIQGRLAPSVDDVVALAGPILRHRMAVNFSARAEGITVESVIDQMCARLA